MSGESERQSPVQPEPDEEPGQRQRGAGSEAAEREPDRDGGRKPPPDDLSEDPAYEPEDEGMKGIKGG